MIKFVENKRNRFLPISPAYNFSQLGDSVASQQNRFRTMIIGSKFDSSFKYQQFLMEFSIFRVFEILCCFVDIIGRSLVHGIAELLSVILGVHNRSKDDIFIYDYLALSKDYKNHC